MYEEIKINEKKIFVMKAGGEMPDEIFILARIHGVIDDNYSKEKG